MSMRFRLFTTSSALLTASLASLSLAACGDSGSEGGTDCQPGTFCSCTTAADCPTGEECNNIGLCVPIEADVEDDTGETDAGDDTTDTGGDDTTVEDTTDTGTEDTVADTTDTGDEDTTVEDTTDTGGTDTAVEDTTDTGGTDTAVEDTTETDTGGGIAENPWIVFTTVGSSGRDQIEFIRADGTGRILLSAAGTLDRTENLQTSPSWSPDGTRIAYFGRATGSTVVDLRIIDFASGDETTISTVLTYISDLSWSPDGTELIFAADTDLVGVPLRSLYRVDASTGATPTLIALSPGGDASPQWASDNTIWYTSSENDTDPNNIYTINPDGSDRTEITSFGAATIFSGISLSSDETEIAFGGEDGIVLYDIADDSDRTIADGGDSEPDFFNDGERLAITRQFSGRIDLVLIDRTGDFIRNLTDDEPRNANPDVGSLESSAVDITNF